MATGLTAWSQTPASNNTADANVNWQEGQAPSTVNDSARAMMASVAKWRDDISGAIVTGGTATAYTVTSNQGFATLAAMNGQIVAFSPNATNTAACTLNVDSLGAKPLRSAPGIELAAGDLVSGTPYVAIYNSSASEFYLHGGGNMPTYIPLGAIMSYSGSTAPNSRFVLPYGQAISRTTYVNYFTLVSTTYGVGDGSTTFNVPNLAGRFVAFKDDMSGSAAGRVTTAGSGIDGTTLGATGGAQSVTLARSALPNTTLGLTGTAAAAPSELVNSNGSGSTGTAGGAGFNTYPTSTFAGAGTRSVTGTTDSMNGNVTQTAVNKMPPAIVLNAILRVL